MHFNFLCDCGRASNVVFYDVAQEKTKSCRHCNFHSKDEWLNKKWTLLRLNPNQALPNEEWGSWDERKFNFICDCSSNKLLAFCDVASENTRSCGCMKSGMSSLSPSGEIYGYVKSLASDAQFSHWFNHAGKRFEYDVYVPSLKLAIEHHGLVWHSEKFAKKTKDREKYLVSLQRGDRLVQIYQDEWEQKQDIIKTYLQGLITPSPKKRVNPVFEVFTNTPIEVTVHSSTNTITLEPLAAASPLWRGTKVKSLVAGSS